MIQYVKRQHLDVSKYDLCIENSIQSRIYAFSWYLDIVADHWDVLVLGDYKAVMPVPWKIKYGIKYVVQPYFCQQLGVFSKEKFDDIEVLHFVEEIPKKFVKVNLQLKNYFSQNTSFSIKKNYILSLNDCHEKLFKSFNKGRKHAIKSAEKHQLTLKKVSVNTLIDIQKDNYSYEFSADQIKKLKDLSTISIKKKNAFIHGVFNKDVFLGGGFFLKTNLRIIYLFSAFNSQGKSNQAASFLINSVIKEYQNTDLILDFEGGNISSIGLFFNSFGAQTENYVLFKRSFL